MNILRFSKHLNQTELGRGTTHEGYFYINKSIRNILIPYLPQKEENINFYEKSTGDKMTTRLTITSNNKEYRLPGLGAFFREVKLDTEDLIVLEFQKNETTGEIKYFYEIHRAPSSIALVYKNDKGFQLLSKYNKLQSLITSNEIKTIKLEEIASEEIRVDSPQSTSFFNLIIDGKKYIPEENGNYLLTIKDNSFTIKKYNSWTISEGEY